MGEGREWCELGLKIIVLIEWTAKQKDEICALEEVLCNLLTL